MEAVMESEINYLGIKKEDIGTTIDPEVVSNFAKRLKFQNPDAVGNYKEGESFAKKHTHLFVRQDIVKTIQGNLERITEFLDFRTRHESDAALLALHETKCDYALASEMISKGYDVSSWREYTGRE